MADHRPWTVDDGWWLGYGRWSIVHRQFLIDIKKEPPVVRAALRTTYAVIYFTLTVAILTEN